MGRRRAGEGDGRKKIRVGGWGGRGDGRKDGRVWG